MDAYEIRKHLAEIENKARMKGLHQPSSKFRIDDSIEFNLYARWKDPAKPDYSPDEYRFFRAETPDGCIQKAFEWVDALPSVEETNMNNFMKLMAKAVDFGRDKGFDVDFISPLEDAMKRLSKNALTAGIHLSHAA
ncbi:conserved hypothetical protein [Hyphomicrobiales bacterium]|nr:conserved hypothetical protein [Hyphomicrobiales bacterium]